MEQAEKQGPEGPSRAPEESHAEGRRSFWRRRSVIVAGAILLGGVVFYGLGYVVKSWTHESTDDAFIDGKIVYVAPRVAGQVKRIAVSDNQLVKAGDLLVELDEHDLQLLRDQKRAALKAADANVESLKANLNLLQTEITTAQAVAKQTAAEAAAAQATADDASSNLKRAQSLIQNHTISPQEFDSAQARAKAAVANLIAAQAKAASDESKVEQAEAQFTAGQKAYDRAVAMARQAESEEKTAALSLSYTRITAPGNGYVTKKAVQEGDYVQIGQRLMALVPEQIYVTANFKETQLLQIRPGQPAEIRIDSVSGGPFPGHVQSIMAGSGARFSLLPPENAVGNYVKVVQRVPVKIVFDKPVEATHVLGPGMSVVPSVRVKSYVVPEALLAGVAAVAAVVIGRVWWVVAARKRVAP